MSIKNFMAVVVEIHQCEPKWWTDLPTNIAPKIDTQKMDCPLCMLLVKSQVLDKKNLNWSFPTPMPTYRLSSQVLDNFLHFTAHLLPLLLSQRCVGNTLRWLTNLGRGFYDQKLKSHLSQECQGILTLNWWDHRAAPPRTWCAVASRAGGPC